MQGGGRLNNSMHGANEAAGMYGGFGDGQNQSSEDQFFKENNSGYYLEEKKYSMQQSQNHNNSYLQDLVNYMPQKISFKNTRLYHEFKHQYYDKPRQSNELQQSINGKYLNKIVKTADEGVKRDRSQNQSNISQSHEF